jgi:hypothetical protein
MSGDEDLFRSLWLNFDKGLTSDDDDDDEIYKPEEPSDDEDDPIVDDGQDGGPSQCSVDLARIFKRFSVSTRLPVNQVFLTPCPTVDTLDGSALSVPQWDLLRHQCRLHFALLCRSIRYVSLCASSECILEGFLTMLHSLHRTFVSAIYFAADTNALLGRQLFVPVMGDPSSSLIHRASDIVAHFQAGAQLDDVLETPAFKEVFEVFEFLGEAQPIAFIQHVPWSYEEAKLLETAAARCRCPEDVQRFAMPGRAPQAIAAYFRDEWRRGNDDTGPRKKKAVDEIEKQAAKVNRQDPNQPFVLDETMKFAVAELPPDLPPNGP